jgi:predicted nucleic acid-binding protein
MDIFLDTNIVLYAYGKDEVKQKIAGSLLAQYPTISTQVINECSHVMRRKLFWSPEKVSEELEILLILVQLKTVDIQHIRSGWKIAARYGFSHFDSLMVASALEAGCQLLYSEDMQHGQIIENRLQIFNPFFEESTL